MLRWGASVGATSYVVEAGSSSGSSDLTSFDIGRADTQYTATSVSPGTYYIRVRGSNGCGTGASSNEVLVTVRQAPAPTPAPTPTPSPAPAPCKGNLGSLYVHDDQGWLFLDNGYIATGLFSLTNRVVAAAHRLTAVSPTSGRICWDIRVYVNACRPTTVSQYVYCR